MTFMDRIIRIERIHNLIRTRSTGTPAELAEKLGISKSQCYGMIKELREEFDAPIYYSRKERSYCYKKDVEFIFGFAPV